MVGTSHAPLVWIAFTSAVNRPLNGWVGAVRLTAASPSTSAGLCAGQPMK
jgi:hypothetical protein